MRKDFAGDLNAVAPLLLTIGFLAEPNHADRSPAHRPSRPRRSRVLGLIALIRLLVTPRSARDAAIGPALPQRARPVALGAQGVPARQR